MSIPCAVLMCHAPIVIPEIAGTRAAACTRTTSAMREAAACIAAHAPEVLVLISPHTPRDRARFGIAHDPQLNGDFGRFGRSELALHAQGAPAAAAMLARQARSAGLDTVRVSGQALDHGALVPLHFVVEAGYAGPVLLIALPYPGTDTEHAFGRAIAATAHALDQRFVVLASGDMSHRLTSDAPAGYHPRAREFDASFQSLIARGDLQRMDAIDLGLRDIAAEDVVDSCAVAASAVGFDARGCRVLSYEGPFGVGYLEAVLHEPEPVIAAGSDDGRTSDDQPPPQLLTVAREALRAHFAAEPYTPPSLPEPWDASRGVFVTLRTRCGELRGCIGHVEPALDTLAQEVASAAIASATLDPRFAPVSQPELAGLAIEISVLSPPEPIAGLAQLDPARYGVLVSSGARRGVLLPAIEGIEGAIEQVRIARRKARIALDDEIELARFEVRKLIEGEQPNEGGRHARH